jgi:uncharacterized membrane protein YeaQ/YmgE (transglycosylase-associated protein family)
MSVNVDDLMRKTKSYWYEDGLAEILAGVVFVAISLLLLADWATPADSPAKWIWTPGFMLVMIICILSGRRVIAWLKERITYPRTGYVAYRQERRSSGVPRAVVAGILGAAVSLAMSGAVIYRHDIARLAPLLMGAAIAVFLVRIVSDIGLLRFYALAIWAVIEGLSLTLLTSDSDLSIALFYLLLGLATTAAGGVTLIRYLRTAAAEAGDE